MCVVRSSPPIVQRIRNDYNIEDCPTVDEIFAGNTEDTTVDVGFIRECYINQFFERLQEYDVYRYCTVIPNIHSTYTCTNAYRLIMPTLLGVVNGNA